MKYQIFRRTWWKENPAWPDGLEPCPGRSRRLKERYDSEEEASAICQKLNREAKLTGRQQRLGLKYEYDSVSLGRRRSPVKRAVVIARSEEYERGIEEGSMYEGDEDLVES